MPHIVLLGDSIFDNAVYIKSGPAVIDHLQRQLPIGWQATLCAVDGDVTVGVLRQLTRVPATATHLLVSVGGNDALSNLSVLEETTATVATALFRLREIVQQFEQRYRLMVQSVRETQYAVALCTIYDPAFPEPLLQATTTTALALFNDCIVRVAIEHGLPVLDLRLVCNELGDYANSIEPSVAGGAKIAASIIELIKHHDFATNKTQIYR